MTVELRHGDWVRLATWAHPYDRTTVAVTTVRGYAAEYREDPEDAVARAQKAGHPLAWTYHGGGTLTDSKFYNATRMEQQADHLARSVTLAPGDVVRIEGEDFQVRVPLGNAKAPRNSDPIHFVLVTP